MTSLVIEWVVCQIGQINYDELASTDNGTCYEVVYGCTFEWADNYDELATTDDSYVKCLNWYSRSNVNTDDGSCDKLGCI